MRETPRVGGDSFQRSEEYQELKGRLHRHLIEAVEEERAPIDEWAPDVLRRFVETKLRDYIARNRLAVNRREAEALVLDMMDELVGLGPIQPLVDDDGINDILVNGHAHVYVERAGKLEEAPVRFMDDRHVLRIIQRIIAPIGRRVDESSPMVDARLADGSRVNAIISPIALDGPCLSIRKFRKDPMRPEDLVSIGSLSQEMLQLLQAAVRGRCNVLVSGGTGAGKTTLLNALSQAIPVKERLVTIEDTAELRLVHPHVVRLETRPPNLEGQNEVNARDLVRNALRMRPDRILIGEIRGVEVIEMLQAMNTGHEGSMATIHANSPKDCLSRLELLVGFGGFSGSEYTLRQNIESALDLIVQIGRLPNGQRRVQYVSEISGLADGQYQVQDLFRHDAQTDRFHQTSPQAAGERLRRALLGEATAREEPRFPRLRYV